MAGRIEDDRVLLDVRALLPGDEERIVRAAAGAAGRRARFRAGEDGAMSYFPSAREAARALGVPLLLRAEPRSARLPSPRLARNAGRFRRLRRSDVCAALGERRGRARRGRRGRRRSRAAGSDLGHRALGFAGAPAVGGRAGRSPGAHPWARGTGRARIRRPAADARPARAAHSRPSCLWPKRFSGERRTP